MLPCNLYYAWIRIIDFFPWCIGKILSFWGNRWRRTYCESSELRMLLQTFPSVNIFPSVRRFKFSYFNDTVKKTKTTTTTKTKQTNKNKKERKKERKRKKPTTTTSTMIARWWIFVLYKITVKIVVTPFKMTKNTIEWNSGVAVIDRWLSECYILFCP